MSDLRTAAQQALNYWESASFGDAVMVDKMDALRAALAQQAEPVQEPVTNNPDPYHLSRILHELAGSASMCWEHVDRAGVFQSTQAAEFVAAAIAEIRQRMNDAALAQQDEPVQEPVACEPQYANDDGWCDWVCPKPIGYLMQCCGCGLIHEVESRVAKYKPRPSEEFEVVGDPDLQVQWRMKRRDDISPKQKTQEPVAWRFEARHIDTAWGPAVSLKRPGPEHKYIRNVIPLYTAPPQRLPLTEEVAALTTQRDALLEALQRLLAAYSVSHSPKHRQSCWDQARAAIKAVEETK